MKTSKLQQITSLAATSILSIRVYLCIIPENEERNFYISLLSRIFGWSQILPHSLVTAESFLLQLPLRFTQREILHLHPLENIAPSAKEELYDFLQSYPSPLVLSGASLGNCIDLYARYSEKALLIDLTQESKWEKKNRLKEYCEYEVQRMGKSISPDALDYLLQERGENIVALESELRKVICQSGTKQSIQKTDVISLVSPGVHDDWKVREKIAFGIASEDTIFYPSKDFLPFLQQIRYLIDLAFFFLHAQQSAEGEQALQKRFPHVKGTLASHYTNLLKDLPIQYCLQAKLILFESEYIAKSSAASTSILTYHLIAKLQCLRKSL